MAISLGSEQQVLAAVYRLMLRRSLDRAVAATEVIEQTLRGYGPIRRVDTELRAGGRVVNQDRDLLPRLARTSGLGLCIYLGNRRIAAANLTDAGHAPQLGGYANAQLVETVLRRREVFRGSVVDRGASYLVACRPLYASERPDEYGPLGMIEAFQDETMLHEKLTAAFLEGVHGSEGPGERLPDRLGTFMTFVEDISRRLQLLALNGNIIASQAGEHGGPFRVVCRELGSLADRAKETAGDFRKLLASIEPTDFDRGAMSSEIPSAEIPRVSPADSDDPS